MRAIVWRSAGPRTTRTAVMAHAVWGLAAPGSDSAIRSGGLDLLDCVSLWNRGPRTIE